MECRRQGRRNMPLCSVITPVHEPDERFLRDANESLVGQDTAWEWLIQYDGPSWDAPWWLSADERVTVVCNGSHQGVSITRNRALSRATSEFVLNLDADDFLLPDALVTLGADLTADPRLAFAVPRVEVGQLDGCNRLGGIHIGFGLLAPGTVEQFWREHSKMPFHAAAALWRTKALLAYGGWPAMQVGEDSGLLLAVAATHFGWYEPKVLFHRREQPRSIMQSEDYWQVHRPRDSRFNVQRLDAIRELRASGMETSASS